MFDTRTHIVCTIGPACADHLPALLRAGMGIARLNFSHGSHASHAALFRSVRAAAKAAGKHVPIIADLQGPKIRLGVLPEKGIEIKKGTSVRFTTGEAKHGSIPVTYGNLHKDVKVGHRMLIEDGLYEVKVVSIKGKDIMAKVVNGGTLFTHKGMNFPDSILAVSSLTEKDKDDAIFATQKGADWVALSFVTSADAVHLLRRIVTRATPSGKVPPRIIVKIEKHEAIDHFQEILEATDGVMVARGDLGVEIPAEDVPIRQKAIVELCRAAGKPVVVATQMLDSMIRNPRPTRAEVSDVANAVFDHTDATMLSGETASGAYPLEATATMAHIIVEAERSPYDDVFPPPVHPAEALEVSIARTLKNLAAEKHIDGVLAFLALAPWAETLHRFHPEVPLFLAVPTDALSRQNALRWGVRPFTLKTVSSSTALRVGLAALKRHGWIKKGMRLAVVLGAEHGEGFDIIEVK